MEYPRYTKERCSNVVLKDPVSLFTTTRELQSGGINSGVSLLIDDTERMCHVIEWTASIDGGLLYCAVVTADVDRADIEEPMYLFDFTGDSDGEAVVWQLSVAGEPPADEPGMTHDLVFFQPRPVYISRATGDEE